MARAARDLGYQVQLVIGTSLATEEFGLIAGPAAEGTLFTFLADPRRNPEAAPVVERFRALGFEPEGYTLYAYAAVQVWAQAAEKAGSLELPAMIASLREHQFDTVLGAIDFDEKGDVTTADPNLACLAGRHLRAAGAKPLTSAQPVSKTIPTWEPDRREWIAITLGLAVALTLAWWLFGLVGWLGVGLVGLLGLVISSRVALDNGRAVPDSGFGSTGVGIVARQMEQEHRIAPEQRAARWAEQEKRGAIVYFIN